MSVGSSFDFAIGAIALRRSESLLWGDGYFEALFPGINTLGPFLPAGTDILDKQKLGPFLLWLLSGLWNIRVHGYVSSTWGGEALKMASRESHIHFLRLYILLGK